MFANANDMTTWEKPSFEELSMNAEIGAYQPDDWDGERQPDPFVASGSDAVAAGIAVAAVTVAHRG